MVQNLTLIIGGGVAVAVAIGAAVLLRPLPDVPTEDAVLADAAVQDVAVVDDTAVQDVPEVEDVAAFASEAVDTENTVDADTPESSPQVQAEPIVPQVVEPVAPAMAEFRFEPDGALLVMGSTQPNAPLAMLIDGEEVKRVEVGADGTFLVTDFLGYSETPRVMRLVADPDGAAVMAERMFVLDANPAPEPEPQVAESEGEAAVDDVVVAAVAQEAATVELAEDTPVEAAVAEIAEVVREESDTAVEAATNDEVAVAVPQEDVPTAAEPEPEPEREDADTGTAETAVETAEPAVETAEAATSDDPQELIVPDVQDAETEVVNAPAVPAILAVSDEGVDVIQPPVAANTPPEVMSTVALDTITYDPEGEVVLQGRAVGSGFVQVYVDNAPVSRLPVDAQGNWRGDLPDVDTGVYTLRIDEVDVEGDVVSRIETPFLREDAQVVVDALADEAQDSGFTVATRTVQPGATLWAIAEERYGSGVLYVNVFEANKDRIRDPDLIYPGQVFIIPEDSN